MKMARPQIGGLLEGDWERLGRAGAINSSTSTGRELPEDWAMGGQVI